MTVRSRVLVPVLAAAMVASVSAGPAGAQVPSGDPTDLPVLSAQTPRGSENLEERPPVTPTDKTIDGDISDWIGSPTGFGGTAVYSAGELVYQDHLFDAYGPDDGRDADRFAATDPVEEAIPGAYRIDGLGQADVAGELGIPVPDQFHYDKTYGDAEDHQDASDLHELRVALDGDRIALLARTTTMTSASSTGLLVLADTEPGSETYEVPFNSGLRTSVADVAFLVADGSVSRADLASGSVEVLVDDEAVASPQGWTNAIEASLPLDAGGDALSLAIATGAIDQGSRSFAALELEMEDGSPHANVANVGFRTDEPVRYWFEKDQALVLHSGTIDPFFYEIDLAALRSGRTQTYAPGPGYHDRIFRSKAGGGIADESGRNGILQHYGVYLPTQYSGDPVPLQWWLHWRGGDAHSGASIVPKVFKQFGEDRDSIVVAPSGRGTSTWYVGKGHVDFLEVWADVFDTFAIDRDRVYVSGHSMGGWGSYLLTLLYPDRFAAAAPAAGPVTMGAWTGADFQGCDGFKFDEYTPCYIEANGSRPRDQHTRKILENSLHVPYAILHGTDDELVPYSGVLRQSERLTQLGYRHRLYTYPGYEHYSHPIADQWAEAADYLHSFARDPNPAHVAYKRDMLFERATEEVQAGGAGLNFDFDTAYWMSGLSPSDEQAGTAAFDGRSLAIAEQPHLVAPDGGAPTAPGQTGPYVITGLQWLDDPTAAASEPVNGFEVALAGADEVTLDLARMAIDTSTTVAGAVTTEEVLELSLDGGWKALPDVLLDGGSVQVTLVDGVLGIEIPPGAHNLTISPVDAPEETTTVLSIDESSDASGQYTDTASVSTLLATAEGTPLGGREISLTLGSRTASATTDGQGRAAFDLELLDAPDDYSLTVAFAGEPGLYSPAVAATPFRITREDSALSIEASGNGAARTLVAELVDADSGVGIPGRTVVFKVDGDDLGTATTDDDGIARFEVPPRYSGKNRRFEANFTGDQYFLGSVTST